MTQINSFEKISLVSYDASLDMFLGKNIKVKLLQSGVTVQGIVTEIVDFFMFSSNFLIVFGEDIEDIEVISEII